MGTLDNPVWSWDQDYGSKCMIDTDPILPHRSIYRIGHILQGEIELGVRKGDGLFRADRNVDVYRLVYSEFLAV